MIKPMTDAETAAHLRKWAEQLVSPSAFSWPTDACGYDQHIRFVEHKAKKWKGGTREEWNAFLLAYADQLSPVPR